MRLRFNDVSVQIRRSPVKDYYAVDIRIRTDGVEKETHELLHDSDFESRFDEILSILKKEVLLAINEIEESI